MLEFTSGVVLHGERFGPLLIERGLTGLLRGISSSLIQPRLRQVRLGCERLKIHLLRGCWTRTLLLEHRTLLIEWTLLVQESLLFQKALFLEQALLVQWALVTQEDLSCLILIDEAGLLDLREGLILPERLIGFPELRESGSVDSSVLYFV